MKADSSLLRQYWINKQVNYSLRTLLTLVCVVFPAWWFGHIEAISPLVLGVIACAIAENDDNLLGRTKALAITLACFTLTTLLIEFLFPTPILFALIFPLFSFAFTMLGAMGSRYNKIAFASVLIAIYKMITETNASAFGELPNLLLVGALSYGIISLIWLVIWPTQQVQHNLSQLYAAIAAYLDYIAVQYHPSETLRDRTKSISDAKENAAVVHALNQTRMSLLSQIRKGKMTETDRYFLRIYFIAQDLHERLIALQTPPQAFREIFFHSDLMFRLAHMFKQQSLACKKMADSVLLSESYHHPMENIVALDDLNISIIQIKNQKHKNIINRLEIIWQNICRIETQFEQIDKLDHQAQYEDQVISDPEVHGIKEMFSRLISQLTPQSLLFRHAVRLSLALFIGNIIIQYFHPERGHWILLTILLVCESSYAATRNKLSKRIFGTILGLMLGAVLLSFFPDKNSQLVLLVSFGVLYFAFRAKDYLISTFFITMLMLMNFSQLGNGYELIIPRILNTLIGCLITVAALRYILPDWQAYRMKGIMADAIEANQHYFAQIIVQFRLGKKDNLAYRQARRNAHNKDVELTQAISNMLNEPGRYHNAVDESFQFLYLNHRILSHISVLGALRQQIEEDEFYELISKTHNQLFAAFSQIKTCLLAPQASLPLSILPAELNDSLNLRLEESDEVASKLVQQLDAIALLLPEMLELTQVFTQKSVNNH